MTKYFSISLYFGIIALLFSSVNCDFTFDEKNDNDDIDSEILLESNTIRYRIPLYGLWKFSIGDSVRWADPGYDDSDWDEIKAPSSWEEQGFHGYDGYAWYRFFFEIPDDAQGSNYLLELGRIDDVDEVFINGRKIGSTGSFPPHYKTAYNQKRFYTVPSEYLRTGESNLVAVRVYDDEMPGGILEGNLALIVYGKELELALNLAGSWKFRLGDNAEYRKENYDDSKWQQVTVPAYWKEYGYANENGYGWYRKSFTAPENWSDKTLVLLLGKIDDMDEVYLNGKIIGFTGKMHRNTFNNVPQTEYLELRSYHIPRDEILAGERNVIAVRVYDAVYQGGIYQGPIGIAEEEDFLQFWRGYFATRRLD